MILRHWQRKERHTQEGEPLFLFPAGDRPQEPQEGREQAEGLPGGEIPGGNV